MAIFNNTDRTEWILEEILTQVLIVGYSGLILRNVPMEG